MKAPTKYISLPPLPDAKNESYMYTRFSYALKKLPSMSNTLRDDIIGWDFTTHSKELTHNFKIDEDILPCIRDMIITLIKKY